MSSPVESPTELAFVAISVAALAAIVGAWILMRALRTTSSKWFFGFTLSFVAWLPVTEAMWRYLFPWENYVTGRSEPPVGPLYFTQWFVWGLLAVAAAGFFVKLALEISRSNNSVRSFLSTPSA